jgi:hypothetical protein
MKILALAATTGLLAFGAATAASAYYFTPRATTFTAFGSVTLTAAQTHVCTTRLTLNTDSSGLSITSATFSGRYCGGVVATGLPWRAFPNEPRSMGIFHMVLTTPSTTCSSAGEPVYAGLSLAGRISVSGARLGQCSISGSLGTSPVLMIAGKPAKS